MATVPIKMAAPVMGLNFLRSSKILFSSVRFASQSIKDEIDQMVKSKKVVIFMKGVPEAPKCGFSNAVVQVLRMHGVTYDSHDVLEREDLRQGIKEYSSWPTVPQIFINGQFVGGCDIVIQMHQNGDLVEELRKAGIRSALLDKAEPEKPETK